MNTLRKFLLPLLVAAIPTLARGQHVLAVKYEGKLAVVLDADGTRPMVLGKGKLQSTDSNQFVLLKGGEFLPLFVAVRHSQVTTSSLSVNDTVDQLNKTFYYSCDLESAYHLSHVFLVITLQTDMADKGLFLYGIGELQPNNVRHIDVGVPMVMESAPGRYHLYLFSAGRELFQSMMPFGVADAALDKLVRKQIENVSDSPPRPFLGPSPEYPKSLRKKKVIGEATVSFLIGFNGAVSDPKLVNATRPEFGKAVMAVIRQWRFLPEMVHGQPTATRAELPFNFKP